MKRYFDIYPVAIPVCGDQPVNANEAERLGFGISQPYGSLDETDLYNALDKVLHDPKYKNTAQRLGSALNDQLTKPMDRAVWWIEHIIRHPTMYQGKSPVHKLYWFQYILLVRCLSILCCGHLCCCQVFQVYHL